jgi:hypothetical protein
MGHLFLSIMCFLVFSGRLFIWSRDVLKLYTIFCISGGRQLEMGDSACNNSSDRWSCKITHILHPFAPGFSCLRLVQSMRCQRESIFSMSISHWNGLSLEVVSTVFHYFQQKVCH